MENAPAEKAADLTIDQTVDRILSLNKAANDACAEASRLRGDLVARLREAGINIRGVSANPPAEGGFVHLLGTPQSTAKAPAHLPVSSLVEAILGGRFG